jgi:hypothetical protein
MDVTGAGARVACPTWITLEDARSLAWRSGATDENLSEILVGCTRQRRIGITALLEHAPIRRVRENWPVCAAELEVMRMWLTARHVEDFLTRAVGLTVQAGNKLQVLIFWGDGAPPLEADTCVLAEVHLHRPSLVFELEAAGFTEASETKSGKDQSMVGPEKKQRAFKDWIAEKYPKGIPPGTTAKSLARDFENDKDVAISDRTVRRALGRR